MSSVFVILNEFYPDDDAEYPSVEIYGGVAYGTFERANLALQVLAEELHTTVFSDETDVINPINANDRYYIQELTRHG